MTRGPYKFSPRHAAELPNIGKFVIPNILSETFTQNDIFLGKQGNKDQFKKIKMLNKYGKF